MDELKTTTIRSWPAPNNIKELQSFLGLANFYHRFIQDFSKVVILMTKLTCKDIKWEWTDPVQAAFDSLKTAFTTAPILCYFDPSKPIILETNASDFAIGAIISQPDSEDKLHPIAFYSYKL